MKKKYCSSYNKIKFGIGSMLLFLFTFQSWEIILPDSVYRSKHTVYIYSKIGKIEFILFDKEFEQNNITGQCFGISEDRSGIFKWWL